MYHFNIQAQSIVHLKDYLLQKGEKIGIIGESGSENLLFYLIMGFVDPSNGKIDIDNFNLQKIKTLQSMIGYVPQNMYLMDDTIQKI